MDKNAKSGYFVLITHTDNSDLTRFFGVQSARSEKVIAIPCSYALLVLWKPFKCEPVLYCFIVCYFFSGNIEKKLEEYVLSEKNISGK